MLNEFECIAPMQIPWQFAVEQSLVQHRKLVMEVLAHVRTMICIDWSVLFKVTSLIISNAYRSLPRLPGGTSKLAYARSIHMCVSESVCF
jgi:hypothetical protein